MQLLGNVKKKFKPVVFLAVLVFGFLVSGCEQRQPPSPPPVPEVATIMVQPQRVMLTTELPGRTSAYRVAEIRPQVNGIIQRRMFQEGSEIKTGELLYQIDPAPYQAAYSNAKAALGKAEAVLPSIRLRVERYRDLVAENLVSRQDYDDAVAALSQAEAEIEYWKAAAKTAFINLGYTRITAPISGRIGRSNVTDGALVTAYQAMSLATIQQLNPIYVDVSQSTTELQRLKRRLADGRLDQNQEKQKKVGLILEDGTSYALEGTLQFRDVTVDPSTGSVILRVIVPNPDGVLLPGMFVRAVVKEGVVSDAILVPQQGVSRNPRGEPVALVVDEANIVQQRILSLDRAIANKWLVLAGLSSGDRLIVEGMLKVRPGAAVKPVPMHNHQAETRSSSTDLPPSGLN